MSEAPVRLAHSIAGVWVVASVQEWSAESRPTYTAEMLAHVPRGDERAREQESAGEVGKPPGEALWLVERGAVKAALVQTGASGAMRSAGQKCTAPSCALVPNAAPGALHERSLEEALPLANSTTLGSSVSLFTPDSNAVLRSIQDRACGMGEGYHRRRSSCAVCWRDRASSSHAREQGPAAPAFFTE